MAKKPEKPSTDDLDQVVDRSLLIAIAIRRYIHCSKKIFRGASLSSAEKADYNSSSMLQPIWDHMAPVIAKNLDLQGYKDSGFDAENGFFEIPVNGRSLYYPFTLAMHPPPPEVLSGLIEAAEKYRMFEKSVICLSGSAPLGGVVDTIGDLDLFEYVKSGDVTDALRQQDPKYRSENILCIETKIAKTEGTWPTKFEATATHSDIHPNKIRRYSAKYLMENNFCKIDMVGSFGEMWGEVTNIIYKSDSEDANEDFPTHTFQEVTVDKKPLANSGSLVNFGRYCFFLRDEIESIANKLSCADQDPDTGHAIEAKLNFLAVKGAKRAISLCAILQYEHESFARIANSKVGKRYVADQLLSLLRDMVGNARTTPNFTAAENAFSGIIRELAEDENGADEFDVQKISQQMLDLVTQMDELCFPIQTAMEKQHDEAKEA